MVRCSANPDYRLGGVLGAFVAFLHTPMRTHVDPGDKYRRMLSGGTIGCVGRLHTQSREIEEEASEEFAEAAECGRVQDGLVRRDE